MLKLCLWCVALLVTLGRAQETTTLQPVSSGIGVLPEDIFPELYEKYREAVEDDKREVSQRRLFRNDREYEIHVQKLKEVNGYKLHNLKIGEKTKLGDTFVYVNNPIESKLPNAYLTLEEFKQSLLKRAAKDRQLESTQEKYTIFRYVTTKEQNKTAIVKTLKTTKTKAIVHMKELLKHVNEHKSKPTIKINNTKITNKTTKEKPLKLNTTKFTNRTTKERSLKHTLKSSKKFATRIMKQNKKLTNSTKNKLRKNKKRRKIKKNGKRQPVVFRANDSFNVSNATLASSDAVVTKKMNVENGPIKHSMDVHPTGADAKYNLAKRTTKEVSVDTFVNKHYSTVTANQNLNDAEDTPRSLIDDRIGRNGNTKKNTEESSPVTQQSTRNVTIKSASNEEVATNKTKVKREKSIENTGEAMNLPEIAGDKTIPTNVSDEITTASDFAEEITDDTTIVSDATEETTIFLDTANETPDETSILSDGAEENTVSSATADETPDETTSLSDVPDETTVYSDNADENMASSDFPDAIAAENTITSDNTTTASDGTVTSDDIKVTSDDITVTSDDTNVGSDDTTVAPDDATAASDDVTTAPDDVTTAPDDVTTASHDANAASDDATTVSDDATAATDDTTVVSDDAKVVSEDTTVVSEDPPAEETPAVQAKEEQLTELTTVKSTRRTLGRPAVFMGGMWD